MAHMCINSLTKSLKAKVDEIASNDGQLELAELQDNCASHIVEICCIYRSVTNPNQKEAYRELLNHSGTLFLTESETEKIRATHPSIKLMDATTKKLENEKQGYKTKFNEQKVKLPTLIINPIS